eukprot:scaffold687946_cov189-Attheya_sp.AAC.2
MEHGLVLVGSAAQIDFVDRPYGAVWCRVVPCGVVCGVVGHPPHLFIIHPLPSSTLLSLIHSLAAHGCDSSGRCCCCCCSCRYHRGPRDTSGATFVMDNSLNLYTIL